ncbi:hypothetical protein LCGC14_0175240 [marine sediment metagenome]|uniref:Uncharacterized protein n=1 Tax=marine sediment metagenome TaxID=412755 RepID=A0A0F9UR84_9ZZZZ
MSNTDNEKLNKLFNLFIENKKLIISNLKYALDRTETIMNIHKDNPASDRDNPAWAYHYEETIGWDINKEMVPKLEDEIKQLKEIIPKIEEIN